MLPTSPLEDQPKRLDYNVVLILRNTSPLQTSIRNRNFFVRIIRKQYIIIANKYQDIILPGGSYSITKPTPIIIKANPLTFLHVGSFPLIKHSVIIVTASVRLLVETDMM